MYLSKLTAIVVQTDPVRQIYITESGITFDIHSEVAQISIMILPNWTRQQKGTKGGSQNKNYTVKGGSPGLVVMGGDSCSKGHGFESQRRILDG